MTNEPDPKSENTDKPPPQAVLPLSAAAHNEAGQDGNHGKKAKHSWVEKLAVFFAFLAFLASGWQGYVARDTEKRQLRAYVSIDFDGWQGIPDKIPLGAKLSFTNHGSTPARYFKRFTAISILPYPLPDHFKFPESVEDSDQATTIFTTIKSDAGWTKASRIYSSSEWTEITNTLSSKRAYVYGYVLYTDVFGFDHHTYFCAFVHPETIKRNPDGSIDTFVWADCPQHNDID